MARRTIVKTGVSCLLALGLILGGSAVAHADDLPEAPESPVAEAPADESLEAEGPANDETGSDTSEGSTGSEGNETPENPDKSLSIENGSPDTLQLIEETPLAVGAFVPPADGTTLPSTNGASAWVSNCTDERTPTAPLGTLGACDLTVLFPADAVPGARYSFEVADVIASQAFQDALGYEGVGWMDHSYAICQPGTMGELIGLTSARPDASRRFGTVRTLDFTFEGASSTVSREAFLEVLCGIPTAPLIYGPSSLFPNTYAPQPWTGEHGVVRSGCTSFGDPGVIDMDSLLTSEGDPSGDLFNWVINWEVTDTEDTLYTVDVLDWPCATEWGLTGAIELHPDFASAPVTISDSKIAWSSDALIAWDDQVNDGFRSGTSGSIVLLLTTSNGLTVTASIDTHRALTPPDSTDPDPDPETETETPDPAVDDEPRAVPAPPATGKLAETGVSSSSGDWALIAALAGLLGSGLLIRARSVRCRHR